MIKKVLKKIYKKFVSNQAKSDLVEEMKFWLVYSYSFVDPTRFCDFSEKVNEMIKFQIRTFFRSEKNVTFHDELNIFLNLKAAPKIRERIFRSYWLKKFIRKNAVNRNIVDTIEVLIEELVLHGMHWTEYLHFIFSNSFPLLDVLLVQMCSQSLLWCRYVYTVRRMKLLVVKG